MQKKRGKSGRKDRRDEICFVCGNSSPQEEPLIPEDLQDFDLDSGPPRNQRSSLQTWVHVCPHCGYAADVLSKPLAGAEDMVGRPAYQRQLKKNDLPYRANAFLCATMLLENAGMMSHAASACMHAAWVCDDAQAHLQALQCRMKAVHLTRMAIQLVEEQHEPEPVMDEVVLVDLLRRTGQFTKAKEAIAYVQHRDVGPVTQQVLAHEQEWVDEKDAAQHTIAEALQARHPHPRQDLPAAGEHRVYPDS